MNVEKELRKINFAKLSRALEGLLRKILLVRQLQREKGMELSMEELDKVSAGTTVKKFPNEFNKPKEIAY